MPDQSCNSRRRAVVEKSLAVEKVLFIQNSAKLGDRKCIWSNTCKIISMRSKLRRVESQAEEAPPNV